MAMAVNETLKKIYPDGFSRGRNFSEILPLTLQQSLGIISAYVGTEFSKLVFGPSNEPCDPPP
jgi:hypothetical protein